MLVSPLPSPKSAYADKIPTDNLAATPAPTGASGSVVPIPTLKLPLPVIQ